MSGRLVLHKQRPLRIEDQYRGPFSLCRTFLQQISWILDQWDESIRSSSVKVVGNEIAEAENNLYEIKQKIWALCVSASSKLVLGVNPAESQENIHNPRKGLHDGSSSFVKSKQSALLPHAENQLVVHDEPGQPIGIQQHESRKTVVQKSNGTHPPLKNLLLDWSVVLDANNRLCLQGILLNEGEWMTSPISVRLGPNTVQTNSGTIYNVAGKMLIPQDDFLPKFVQDKFQLGFPPDWESVHHQWVIAKSKNADKDRVGANILKENNQKNEVCVVLHNTKKSQNPSQNDMLMPPPQEVPKSRKRNSTLSVGNTSPQVIIQERVQNNMIVSKNSPLLSVISRRQQITSTAVKNTPNLKVQSLPEVHSMPNKYASRPSESEVPRFSKRILSRSFKEISMDESNANLNESIAKVDEVKLLSHWSAELSKEAGGVVLKGRLLNQDAKVLKNDFTSNCVYNRLQSDLVETVGGDCYRLIGPSAAVYSESKMFDYGFPANWKTVFLNKSQNKHSSEIKAVKTRGNSFRGKSASIRSEPSESSVASTAQNSKRQSVKIQQLIKQQISQGHTGMENSGNGRKRLYKRPISNSQSLQQDNGLVKKRKAMNAVAETDANDESLGNVSDVSEYQWKQELLKSLKTAKNKPAEPESASKKEDENQEEVSKKKDENSKVNKPSKPTDKYVIGLLTDCESDLDFNIF